MRIDLHCHSKYSHDNYLEPEEVVEEALKKKLDGVCFTEHYSLMASLPVKKIDIPEGFFVFRGVEISTNMGHMLVYGLKDDSWNIWSRNHYLDVFEVLEMVHALGGICVAAHPFRGWDSFGEKIFSIKDFDAIETHNGLNHEDDNIRGIHAAQLNHLPSIGGSDCHHRERVGSAFTEFKNPVQTIDELIDEIRTGHCKGMMLEDYPSK